MRSSPRADTTGSNWPFELTHVSSRSIHDAFTRYWRLFVSAGQVRPHRLSASADCDTGDKTSMRFCAAVQTRPSVLAGPVCVRLVPCWFAHIINLDREVTMFSQPILNLRSRRRRQISRSRPLHCCNDLAVRLRASCTRCHQPSAVHRIIAIRCHFVIVNANLDRMFAYPRLPERT